MSRDLRRARKRGTALLAASVPLSMLLTGTAAAAPTGDRDSGGNRPPAHSNAPHHGPTVVSQVKDIIKVQGRYFRDLNDNGRLDPYEDWRRSAKDRAADLVGRMTLAEKAGLMHITSERRGAPSSADPHPDTVGYVRDRNIRYLVIRDNPTAFDLADRANDYQEIAESTRLGIPIVFTSNPRNHVSTNLEFGIVEASGQFSTWPGTLGLAAAHDPALIREFAQIARKEWRAAGIEKNYGYQIETATEPRWRRVSGTFGESPDLNAAYARELVLGFQGEHLSSDSVAQTVKHFPGDGAVYKGLDPHNANGQWAVYPTPGSLYAYQLPPFQAAIDAGASSVMSYYNRPNNELSVPQLGGQPFEDVAGAYNKALITDLLRTEMGHTGYVNSDSGMLTTMPWGVSDLTLEQRYAKAIKAGTNLFSDYNDPSGLVRAVGQGLLTEADLNPSVRALLTEMFALGLFENPYVDPQLAQKIAESPRSQAKADEAHRKSIVLMRNDQDLLPLTDANVATTRLYVEVVTGTNAAAQTAALKELIGETDPTVRIVDNLAEATAALVWVRPNTYEISDTEGVSIELNANTGVDVARVREIEATVPTILAINMVNPWVINEIEPDAAAVVATFNVKADALVDVLRGRFNPTGRLPLTVPKNSAAVENNASDVPGYAEAFDYAYTNRAGDDYTFGFGLSYR
ncbi:glycoside hydrolase family 3 protein [Micromonospora sp. NPDC005806]|uniref:glycoside hydrolase family 3 protein n=1 Tax=Micromonospora sp. NPDC005806 TaxID=3364234 RepID=UPI003696628B